MTRAKQIFRSEYNDTGTDFKFSNNWFLGFRKRHRISFRKKTHVAQKSPAQLRELIEDIHKTSQSVRRRGTYQLSDLANMDQTPLPFVMDDGKTYDKTGSSEVWVASGSSGLEKRQCTVQLTIFADGTTMMPLIIFRGKGLRIKVAEKRAWDKRVKVMFQINAWCDEPIMKSWITEMWGSVFLNPPTPFSSGKILYADVHPAQQTDGVKIMLQRVKTSIVNVPKGTTSRVQPLDVAINKPFKNFVRREFEEHIDKNLELYTNGKISASERRVLTTKWVADAWQSIKGETDLIKRSFLKCGISNALDGSENHCVNIKGIEGYTIPDPEEEYELLEDESEDEDSDGYEYVLNAEVEVPESNSSSSSDTDGDITV